MTEISKVAEQVLLGRLLEGDDDTFLASATSVLTPAAFTSVAHQVVFTAICRLVGDGMPVDLPMVAETLTARGQLTEIGGASTLSAMTTASLSASARAPQQHLEALASREQLGRLQAEMERALDLIRDGQLGSVDEVQARLSTVFDAPSFQSTVLPDIGVQVQDLHTTLQTRLQQGPEGIDGVPTGWADLDGGQDAMGLVKGLKPGWLTILAARPGTGKTTAIVDWVRAACNAGKGVVFFSLEQTAAELTELLVVAECGNLHRDKLQDPAQLSDIAWDKVSEAMANVAAWNLIIDDSSRTLPRMRRVAAAARSKFQANGGDLDVMFEDYIQLTDAADPQQAAMPRAQQISDIANGFKAMAKDMGISVVAAAQFNRGPTESDRAPRISDMKGSGGLEEAADLVVGLHRPFAVDPHGSTETPDDLTCLMLKHRHGRAGGSFSRTFLGEFARTSEPRPRQFTSAPVEPAAAEPR
ncbi:replicative DNA helicase [Prescottella subtropica]|uniref:replicative DNA helicase n=1 Tax=Prescottella subtropica TaxID=2545757 RepID=UPI0013868CC4|nr:replicative DNA helicase [Prescottella subtropica]